MNLPRAQQELKSNICQYDNRCYAGMCNNNHQKSSYSVNGQWGMSHTSFDFLKKNYI